MAHAARRSPSRGWLLDEVSRAGRENLDIAHVARYDEKEDAAAAAEVALLVGLGLDGRSQVVDLGAGTGQFTLAVAPSCARVVAVDVSPVMLEEHIRDEHSTFTWLSEPMMERAGFRIEDATYTDNGIFAEYVARAF
jgi:2-polyprenyl-3-methyl-5-hydroxy-6-metoxy-1,4-benzoquinol methylase